MSTSSLNERAFEYINQYISLNLEKTQHQVLINFLKGNDSESSECDHLSDWIDTHFVCSEHDTFKIETSYEIIEAINYIIVNSKRAGFDFNSPENTVEGIINSYLYEVLLNDYANHF